MDERIRRAGATAAQVQVVWLKQAEISPARLGEFPAHARVLRDNVAIILHKLKARFPNLCLAYLSSRIYAGYPTTALNPEPYAYESAFSVRWLIEAQIDNDPNLNCDATKGPGGGAAAVMGPVPVGRRDAAPPERRPGLAPGGPGPRRNASEHLRPAKSRPDAAGLLQDRRLRATVVPQTRRSLTIREFVRPGPPHIAKKHFR